MRKERSVGRMLDILLLLALWPVFLFSVTVVHVIKALEVFADMYASEVERVFREGGEEA
jgi:hypothetical protein